MPEAHGLRLLRAGRIHTMSREAPGSGAQASKVGGVELICRRTQCVLIPANLPGRNRAGQGTCSPFWVARPGLVSLLGGIGLLARVAQRPLAQIVR